MMHCQKRVAPSLQPSIEQHCPGPRLPVEAPALLSKSLSQLFYLTAPNKGIMGSAGCGVCCCYKTTENLFEVLNSVSAR